MTSPRTISLCKNAGSNCRHANNVIKRTLASLGVVLVLGTLFLLSSSRAEASVTVTSLSPTVGNVNGTTVVKFTGSGFTPQMNVWFGAQQGRIVRFVSPNEAYVIAPAHPQAAVQVGIIENQFNYFRMGYVFQYVNQAPATKPPVTSPVATPSPVVHTTLTGISPNSASANTGVNVLLTGSNFVAGSRVRIAGSYAGNVQVVSSTQIRAALPGMAAGSYTVEVVNPDNSVASLNNAMRYVSAVTIVTTAIPGATVGKVYSTALSATGGTAPYSWSLAGGALLPGLTLNGQGSLAGSVAKAGSGSFVARVRDSKGAIAQRSFAVTATTASTDPSPAASGKGLTSCQAINSSGEYYLENDVTCTSQGFAINANNVSLNLNGHTITYGNSSTIAPAISICDNWYNQLPQNACGSGQHAAPQIFNGKIVQSKQAHPFTHAIWVGQANGITGGSIHDLTVTIQQTGTQFFHGDFPGIGWKIQNNTINDNVTNIQQPGQSPLGARSQFQGVVIHMDDGAGAGSGDTISGNTFNGSPQGAIMDSNQNTQIYDNVITLSSYYSNDYGITVLTDGINVYNNVVKGRGRGIDAESSQFTLQGNNIDVHEEANNSEYGGCELDGTDGIRIKNYVYETPSTGWHVTNNTVRAEATYCMAHGLRFTDLASQVQGTISGNNFTLVAGKQPDYGISFSGIDNPQIDFINNTFNASNCAQIDDDGSTDGADVTIQTGQHWSCSQKMVVDADMSAAGGVYTPNYPEFLNIEDNTSNHNISCGAYSVATMKIGSYTTHCGN